MRIITPARRKSFEASTSGDFDLVLIKLSGPVLQTPFGICNDTANYVMSSWSDRGVIRSEDAITYFGFMAEISLISDGEQPPKTTLRIQNIDGIVGNFMQVLESSPRLRLQLFSDAAWSTTLTATGLRDLNGQPVLARYPLGTPTLDYQADYLRINKASGAAMIECEIGSFDLTSEPYPALRTTRERTPGLFR